MIMNLRTLILPFTALLLLAVLFLGFFLWPESEIIDSPSGSLPISEDVAAPSGRADTVVEPVPSPQSNAEAVRVVEILTASGKATTSPQAGVVYFTGVPETIASTPPDGPKKNLPYSIFFVEFDNSFQIVLDEQPIGRVRREAEKAFLAMTGLNESQACMLTYQVVTTIDTDSEYGGTNLGFTFCPGSTVLREI